MRASPPATGNIAVISAKVRARNIIATAPIVQEMMAAGPASWLARRGEKSQPEPRTPPTAMKVRPMSPISRRKAMVGRGLEVEVGEEEGDGSVGDHRDGGSGNNANFQPGFPSLGTTADRLWEGEGTFCREKCSSVCQCLGGSGTLRSRCIPPFVSMAATTRPFSPPLFAVSRISGPMASIDFQDGRIS